MGLQSLRGPVRGSGDEGDGEESLLSLRRWREGEVEEVSDGSGGEGKEVGFGKQAMGVVRVEGFEEVKETELRGYEPPYPTMNLKAEYRIGETRPD
ncbi:hypothetical protein QJS04_geneDACA008948 [Acorus gramineus]|uniref:Uncharacterized protein n=1 Tax=Acorus gramineus TaxID=55184 RepID=A0AAV9AEU9_ACOGR|nr:hypothetical protein QJS04_geneDACA008948 [Acorus gramineus]